VNLANLITSSRIYLSPFFFTVYFLPIWTGKFHIVSIVLLWFLFIVIELSDLFDGIVARLRKEVTDLGKILDPFSDVISRITYFTCFTVTGIMPEWLFVVFMYREFGIIFLRGIMLKKGIAMGARLGGKLKAVMYALSGIFGLIYLSMSRLNIFTEFLWLTKNTSFVIFCLAAVFAVISFFDYLVFVKKSNGILTEKG